MSINFVNEEISFILAGKRQIKKWIQYIASEEGKEIGELNYFFSNDEFVKEINRKYLKHNYNTDIITFNHNVEGILFADIFISVDTVRENAIKYSISFNREIQRVIIHGVLHLIGYDDISDDLQATMRNKEDYCLEVLGSKFSIK